MFHKNCWEDLQLKHEKYAIATVVFLVPFLQSLRRQDLRVTDGTFGIESRLSFEARAAP